MESHTCDLCGEDNERLVHVAGVGMICEACERREFGPFDDEDA